MWYRYLLLFVLVLLPAASQAQFDVGSFGTPQLDITLEPAFPSPGESFAASISDTSSALYGSRITWSYGGEAVAGSDNLRSVTLTAGAAGVAQTLRATLQLPQGGSQVVEKTINPAYLDIIIEPQTRTPVWYDGRALPSLGSQINATALVNNGSFFTPSTLVYTWQVEQKVLEGGPIRGGNRVSFATPRGAGVILRVTAADLTGRTIASRAIRVGSVVPELYFYEQHALYGQQQRPVVAASNIIGNTIKLQAEPYYLDTRVYNQPDIAQWEINSRETANGVNNPYEITLNRGGTNGRTMVNFHVRSLREVLQGVEEEIALNF